MKKNLYIYICITESLLCTAEMKHNIVNQLCFNRIKKKKKETVFSVRYKKCSNVYGTVDGERQAGALTD